MNPDTQRLPLRIGSPADILAAVPYLLGFHPDRSLVVIGTRPPSSNLGGSWLRDWWGGDALSRAHCPDLLSGGSARQGRSTPEDRRAISHGDQEANGSGSGG